MPGRPFAYRIGDQQRNPHGPGTKALPLAGKPVQPRRLGELGAVGGWDLAQDRAGGSGGGGSRSLCPQVHPVVCKGNRT